MYTENVNKQVKKIKKFGAGLIRASGVNTRSLLCPLTMEM
jgi:hypothetical protein